VVIAVGIVKEDYWLKGGLIILLQLPVLLPSVSSCALTFMVFFFFFFLKVSFFPRMCLRFVQVDTILAIA
jgi:hypothetical protein